MLLRSDVPETDSIVEAAREECSLRHRADLLDSRPALVELTECLFFVLSTES